MNGAFNYLALGDSYSIGEGVEEKERWPILLANELSKFKKKNISAKIVAQTGWSCDELIAAIQNESISNYQNLVSICIGVNDQYRGYPVDDFKSSFLILLNLAIAFADHKKENVVVLSIPDWSVTPFAKDRNSEEIAQAIKAYNQLKQSICEQKGVSFINITELTQLAATDRSYLTKDGLHYSKKMHQLWVKEVITKHLNK